MGTPRASASLDQIRNVHSNGSRGGESAANARSVLITERSTVNWLGSTTNPVGAHIVFVADAESLLASGCDEGAVFFGDVTQHVILAQQRGW